MEEFQSQKIFSYVSIWFLLHFSTLFIPSTSYTLPDQFFINCGSASSLPVYGRAFTGDENPGNFALSSGDSEAVEESSSAIPLYQSARIFRKSSWYHFDMDQNGTHVVRFHFFPFSSLGNLSDARFSVLASGFSFCPISALKIIFPLIEEFLLKVPLGKFKIGFLPYKKNSFAFVNAIEVFLAPDDLIPDSVLHVTREGSSEEDHSGLLNSSPLHVIHRINVGGSNIMPNNDSLLRYWIPDDDYLLNKNSARNSEVYAYKPKYQSEGATEFDAPDSVYNTAKEMNIDTNSQLNYFNISCRFDVKKGADHLVRVHFCDIVSRTTNELLRFNFYINGKFSQEMWPYDVISQPAAPFYKDFVVDSDDSSIMLISVGPKTDSKNQTAFLNGVEIMELIRALAPGDRGDSAREHLLIIIIGSCAGGVILVLIILSMLFLGLRKRKWQPVEAFDWPSVHFQGGSSCSRTTVRTASSSPLADLHLGLKVPFSEILYATKRFDPKLMIGEGGFGKVYKGMLRNGMKVAVKRSEAGHGQGLPEFQTEIMVLSKIRHHHLVSLIGYCDERDEMILIYEFMEKGTLRNHLYMEVTQEANSGSSKLSWDERLKICIGAAKGLHYLHTGSAGAIIHRDIKSTNILLDENYVAKVADFGLSRSSPLDQTHVSTDVKGSFGYLDPEYFRCLQLTQKSDGYSFGVVLLEVLCARPVIDHLLPREQVNLEDWGTLWQRKGQLEKIIDPLLVGRINPNSLRKFGETVEKCLQECGANRPSMVDVLWDLEYCLRLQHTALPKEPYEDSTTEVSWGLPMTVVQRLPSNSFGNIGEVEHYIFSDGSQVNAADEVFSQLKLDEAR